MSSSSSSFVSGAAAGCVASGVLQPLDVVKTRLIAGHGLAGLSSLTVRQLYSGVVPSLWRVGLGAGTYFAALSAVVPDRDRKDAGSARIVASGAGARMVALTVQSPLTVVKTRYEAGRASGSLASALAQLWRGDGVRALFRGIVPVAARDAPYSGLYLLFYTRLKRGSDSPAVQAGSAAAAASMAALVTQPPDVVRTRMQLDPAGGGVADAVRAVLRERGPAGLLSGLAPRLIKRSASGALVWVMYEQFSRFL